MAQEDSSRSEGVQVSGSGGRWSGLTHHTYQSRNIQVGEEEEVKQGAEERRSEKIASLQFPIQCLIYL